ncbi:MAG: DoxX family protein [Flavobacteriales bacterium]|nr:DoxX family protein [Flavobacteriales bacterium]
MKARIFNIIGWFFALLLFALFALSGASKIFPIEFGGEVTSVFWDMRFASWELPVWFQYFVRGLEILGTIGLLIKGLRAYAGIGFTALMIGAIGVYLTNLEPGMIVRPIALALMASVVTWVRRYELFYFMRSPADDLDSN